MGSQSQIMIVEIILKTFACEYANISITGLQIDIFFFQSKHMFWELKTHV